MDQARYFKDFATLYNKISESCFTHCVNQLGERDLSQDEARCVDICAKKYVNVNHKVFEAYMEIQSQIMKKKLEEGNNASSIIPNPELLDSNSSENSEPRTADESKKLIAT